MVRRWYHFFFCQAEDGIRDDLVTGVQTCALPICLKRPQHWQPDSKTPPETGAFLLRVSLRRCRRARPAPSPGIRGLLLEGSLQPVEMRHQRIADRALVRRRGMDRGVEAADPPLQ